MRDLAVRKPKSLPAPWHARFEKDPVPTFAASAVLIENQQWRMLSGLSKRARVAGEYDFPEELACFLDSEIIPIRVYYESENELGLARGILEAAEISWQREVAEWGFFAPPLVTTEGRYRIYVGDAGEGAGGYMNPFAWYPDVEWDACVSYVLIDDGNVADSVGPVVAHELNHAMQASMDCLEQLSFFENTSTFVMAPVFPDDGTAYQNGVLSEFQSKPESSTCRGETGGGFMYGGFLWPHFLAYTYGNEASGPILIRRIWEGAMQTDGINAVNYMKSIDDLLKSEHGATVDEAFEEFSIARFFLDDRAEFALASIKNASQYHSNPHLSGTITVNWTTKNEIAADSAPEEYGVNYWNLVASSDFSREVSIDFSTDAVGPWALMLFSTADDNIVRVEPNEGIAHLTYTPSPGETRFLAIARTGDEEFSPAEIAAAEAYELTVGPTVPAPVIDGAYPKVAMQSTEVEVTIEGEHFQEGAVVRLSPEGISVNSVTFVDDTTLRAVLTIGADSPACFYTLTVENPDGAECSSIGALEVRALEPVDVASKGGEEDCACIAVGGAPLLLPSLLQSLLNAL